MTHLSMTQIAHLAGLQFYLVGGAKKVEPGELKRQAAEKATKDMQAEIRASEFDIRTQHGSLEFAAWRPALQGFADAELHGGPLDGGVFIGGRAAGKVLIANYSRPVGETEYEQDETVAAVEYSLDG